ncbi:hypothetical protein [Brevundimonas sp.]|uniref:hypothetical protein n=1 Tax=Brevundimonas sp. TaxID=1871086 RepID=UPI001A1B7268|nr:hypothetical protein [Brevundimonas sp.]MBJ7484114.1 hypothetical protein [Brevundimonas sp.]
MGRRADPDVWALTGREGLTDFLELYRAWHELVDYDPPPVLGETALESDRRGEAAYARLKAVEASLLNHQPTSPVEIIGMLEVIASDEWVSTDQMNAIHLIQSHLATKSLKRAISRQTIIAPEALSQVSI